MGEHLGLHEPDGHVETRGCSEITDRPQVHRGIALVAAVCERSIDKSPSETSSACLRNDEEPAKLGGALIAAHNANRANYFFSALRDPQLMADLVS
jgi:hypothetical protein